jgi:cephalosporin hydroxylase
MGADAHVRAVTQAWFDATFAFEYTYHFRWMGLPIIQYPQDMVAMQEIIWDVKPDLIIETGVARGGSVVFYASMLAMMGLDGQVVGIDIDIRPHNRAAVEAHPMAERITLLQGSSVADDIIAQVRAIAAGRQRVLVVLDSLHTHDHVLRELELYAPLVSPGSYLVVFDTVIEDMRDEFSQNRPWGHGNNPKTAVHAFLQTTDAFVIDTSIPDKLLITVAPDGYLRRIR